MCLCSLKQRGLLDTEDSRISCFLHPKLSCRKHVLAAWKHACSSRSLYSVLFKITDAKENQKHNFWNTRSIRQNRSITPWEQNTLGSAGAKKVLNPMLTYRCTTSTRYNGCFFFCFCYCGCMILILFTVPHILTFLCMINDISLTESVSTTEVWIFQHYTKNRIFLSLLLPALLQHIKFMTKTLVT